MMIRPLPPASLTVTFEPSAVDREPNGGAGSRWREVMELQARIFRRGTLAGEFVDEDPAVLARMVTAMIQVQLGHWLESGSMADKAA